MCISILVQLQLSHTDITKIGFIFRSDTAFKNCYQTQEDLNSASFAQIQFAISMAGCQNGLEWTEKMDFWPVGVLQSDVVPHP